MLTLLKTWKLMFISLTLVLFSQSIFAKSITTSHEWHAINTGISDVTIISFAIDPSNTKFMYAGSATKGLFYTRDGGLHWQAGDPQFLNYYIRQIFVDPIMTSHVFMIVGNNTFPLTGKLYRSTDAGQTWQEVTIIYNSVEDEKKPFRPISFAFNPKYTNEIYIGDNRGRVWKSYDNGMTWNINFNIGWSVCEVKTIAVNPKDPREVYFGINNWLNSPLIYKTEDSGKTWVAINYNFQNDELAAMRTIIIDPKNPNIIYAFMEYFDESAGLLFKSIDAGKTWNLVAKSPAEIRITTAIIDPYNTHLMYALYVRVHDLDDDIKDIGVYISSDSGLNWQSFNNMLPNRSAYSLLLNQDYLYAGIKSGGVYMLQL